MMKKILKGVKESLKELSIIGRLFKNIFYILVGFVYEIDYILDKVYDFVAKQFKKLRKRIQKILFYLIIGTSILGVISLYRGERIIIKTIERVQAKEVVEAEKTTNNEVVVEQEKEVCVLDEVSCKIKEVANNYGIDYKMAIAIAKWETGYYTSHAFKNLNNVGGMMYWNGKGSQLQSFESLDKGIEAYVSNLKYNYFDLGLNTIESIQKKYAPVGAANDPNNLNSNWVRGVSKIYNEIEG